MDSPRRLRQSCEPCRARKSKCSGDRTGCARCLSLGLACHFGTKGAPGRPRKHFTPDDDDDGGHQRHDATLVDLALDFESASQLSAVPRALFEPCLSHDAAPVDPRLTPQSAALQQQSCRCADDALDMVRTLKRGCDSHEVIRTLRLGSELIQGLLTCPICYDVSKPPRLTLQNVLLVGRLAVAVSAGYLRYLEWARDSCTSLSATRRTHKVHIGDDPGLDATTSSSSSSGSGSSNAPTPVMVGFHISGAELYGVITDGMRKDAARLSDLGRQFEARQYGRHLVGHEACRGDDAQPARCWKEESGVAMDPSDICPQSPGARALTPCYRVVEEVRARFREVAEVLGEGEL